MGEVAGLPTYCHGCNTYDQALLSRLMHAGVSHTYSLAFAPGNSYACSPMLVLVQLQRSAEPACTASGTWTVIHFICVQDP